MDRLLVENSCIICINYNIYEYNTRISEYMRLPSVSSDLSKSNLRYKGIIIWIEISNDGFNAKAPMIAFKLYASIESDT